MKHILFLCCCLILTSCATTAPQRDATAIFGLATDRVGRMGEDEFAAIRRGIITMNKFQAVLDASKASPDLAYDAPATTLATAERVSACKTLRMYGDLLMRLASDDRTQFVHRAAVVFMDSAGESLDGPLDARQQAAIDYVIEGMARIWTERRKAESIRNVVLAFEDDMNDLADRILLDLTLDGSPSGFLAAYDDAARRLQLLADSRLDRGEFRDMNERKRIIDACYMARKGRIRAAAIGLRMHSAVATFKMANSEIVSGVRQGDCDPLLIKKYGRMIQQLANLKQVLP
jgi:hypothetical protein